LLAPGNTEMAFTITSWSGLAASIAAAVASQRLAIGYSTSTIPPTTPTWKSIGVQHERPGLSRRRPARSGGYQGTAQGIAGTAAPAAAAHQELDTDLSGSALRAPASWRGVWLDHQPGQSCRGEVRASRCGGYA